MLMRKGEGNEKSDNNSSGKRDPVALRWEMPGDPFLGNHCTIRFPLWSPEIPGPRTLLCSGSGGY